jgi:hypothetical protein
MNPTEIAMLVGGIILLLVLLALVTYCVIKRRAYKGLLAVIPFAILMIGFPSIKSFKVPGFEADLKDSISGFRNNPEDPKARAKLDQALDDTLTRPAKSLTPEVRSNLVVTVNELNRRPNLSAQSRLTLSRAQLALGRTNEAAADFHHALRQNTNLVVDPRLRKMMNPIPH